MFPDTQIAPALIQAYRETHYEVRPAQAEAFTLHIDHPCAGLRAAHQRHGVACSAFITACNPYSQTLDDAANATRQAALLADLEAQGRRTDAGQGRHPGNGWPAEPSLLVYGLGLEAARAMGQQLEQNAIVWCGADAVPRLVLLR